jgi:hypothetical protein
LRRQGRGPRARGLGHRRAFLRRLQHLRTSCPPYSISPPPQSPTTSTPLHTLHPPPTHPTYASSTSPTLRSRSWMNPPARVLMQVYSLPPVSLPSATSALPPTIAAPLSFPGPPASPADPVVVQRVGFGGQDVGCRVWGVGCSVSCVGCRVWPSASMLVEMLRCDARRWICPRV